MKYKIYIMLGTNKGNLIQDSNDTFQTAGINPDAPLTEKQTELVKKFGLDVDSATKMYNSRSIDGNRISKAEMLARGKAGETATLAMKDYPNTEPLTNAQAFTAIRMGVDPTMARRAMGLDEQSFVPQGEKRALEEKKGAWGHG